MRDYDIESDLKQEKFQNIKLVQGDRGNKIKINIYENGQPVSLTGCSITAKYKRADGEIINDGVIENIHDNSFDAVMDSSITKVAGTLKMLFTIEKDAVKVSAFLLLADVREGIGESSSSGGSAGGGEVTVDLSDYYKKIETYSRKEIDAQFKDIVNEIPYDNIRNYSIIGNGVQISQEVLYNFFDTISNKENISLFFPPGKYNMENMIFRNIENTKNLTIYGYGAEFYWETCDISKNMFSFKNCENINILGVKFKGAGMNTSINANEDILNFHLCKNIKVRDCIFTDIGSVAIRFGFGNDDTQDNPIENVILEDCYFENVFQIGTTPSGCINYKCLNNTFVNIGGSVKFAQRYKKGHHITIEGNYILANNQDSVQCGIEIYGYSDIYVKNNYIKSKNNCILIYNNDEKNYISTYQNITIEDNEIYAIDKNGIYLKNVDDTDVNNIKVINNKITMLHTNNNYYPLSFEGKGFKNLFICNNNFTDVNGYAIEFNCSSINTSEDNNFVIENNTCSNVKNFIVVRKDINELKLISNNFNISSILIGLLANIKNIYICDNILNYKYSDFTNKNIESMYIKNNILECNRVYDGGNISNAYSQNNIFNKPEIEGAIIKQQTGNYHGVDNFYNLEKPLLSLNGAKMYDKSINYKTNGVPTSVPLFIGQICIDADNSKIYIAKDEKEVSDWICLN